MHRENRAGGRKPFGKERIPPEDFFRLDDCLERTMRRGVLRLDPVVLSIFVRTVLAAEIRTTFTLCSVPAGSLAAHSIAFALYYSRFFEVAPAVQPPPGPRPTLRNPTLVGLARHGLLFRRNDDLTSRRVSELFAEAGLTGEVAGLLVDSDNLLTGAQILDAAGGRRLLVVHELPKGRAPGSRAPNSSIGVDCFERAGRDARYWPRWGAMMGVETLCFRRRERIALKGRYAAFSFPLADP